MVRPNAFLKTNDYVVAQYEGEFFPGIVLDVSPRAAYVRTMVKSGPSGWKWPDEEDELWYDLDKVVEHIKP
ncbi:hypothetical protein PR048_011650 [Dryococelus australis]|uniref:Uncharacterized protein n=1 Tax=Dryococelus australis TaxID=614101 RepID=A0ABQ9HM72_9NEOP|nr:hypothetical protein PR048_011650 [Dryococelus australis]